MIQTTEQVRINEQTITVGLGEVFVTQDPSLSVACFGLGSCICICAFDPITRIAGMAHVVLPECKGTYDNKASTKYADVAVPFLIKEIENSGGFKAHLKVKLVGGAQMIHSAEFNDAFEMGVRNLRKIKEILANEKITITGEDTGGNYGRSVWMFVKSGKVLVRKAGEEPYEL